MRPLGSRAVWLLLPLAGCAGGPAPGGLTPGERREIDALLREGDQARRNGDLAAAEAAYAAALEIHPDLAEARYQRGNLCLQRLRETADLRHGEAAVNEYTAALRIIPTFAKALYNRAVAYYQLAEYRWADLYRLAARDLQRLLESDPRDADAHFFLASIYDRHLVGMEQDALKHYLKYIELGGRKQEAQKRAMTLARQLEAASAEKADPAPPAPKPRS